jgi:hypothetical protein
LTVLEKDAVDQQGNPLPGKPNLGPAPGSVAKKTASRGNDSGPEKAATEEDS